MLSALLADHGFLQQRQRAGKRLARRAGLRLQVQEAEQVRPGHLHDRDEGTALHGEHGAGLIAFLQRTLELDQAVFRDCRGAAVDDLFDRVAGVSRTFRTRVVSQEPARGANPVADYEGGVLTTSNAIGDLAGKPSFHVEHAILDHLHGGLRIGLRLLGHDLDLAHGRGGGFGDGIALTRPSKAGLLVVEDHFHALRGRGDDVGDTTKRGGFKNLPVDGAQHFAADRVTAVRVAVGGERLDLDVVEVLIALPEQLVEGGLVRALFVAQALRIVIVCSDPLECSANLGVVCLKLFELGCSFGSHFGHRSLRGLALAFLVQLGSIGEFAEALFKSSYGSTQALVILVSLRHEGWTFLHVQRGS